MKKFDYGDRVIVEGRSWVDDNGIRHPHNFAVTWSEEKIAEMGLVLRAPDLYDHEYYFDFGIERDLDDVKKAKTNQCNATAASLLAKTDWMVVRGVERPGKPVPANVSAYREAVRDAADEIVSLIDACGTIDDIIALFNSGDTHIWPEEL